MTDSHQTAAVDNDKVREPLHVPRDEEVDQVSGGLSMYDFWPDKAILLLSHLVSSYRK